MVLRVDYNEGMMIDRTATDIDERETDMAKAKNTPEVQEVEVEEIEVFSAKDLAVAAGTDPKTFRRWLRSNFARDNKGERWVFDAEMKAEVLARFAATPEVTEEVDLDDDIS